MHSGLVVCLRYRGCYGQIYALCRLSPELYLRRPPALFPEWRLDRLLLKKAKEGVKVYVIVYKEVSQTMSMGSHHTKVSLTSGGVNSESDTVTKSALEALHPNIACMVNNGSHRLNSI